jgi:hypothetical protein
VSNLIPQFTLEHFSEYLFKARVTPDDTDSLLPLFGSKSALPAERGLGIYRNNLLHTLIDVLAANFPVLQKVLTDKVFMFCARAYIYEHPSVSGDLNAYGSGFSGFLAKIPELKEHPYLNDLGNFEYLLEQVYYATSDEPTTGEMLQKRISNEGEATRLNLRASMQILQTSHIIHPIWKVYQESAGDEEVELIENESTYLIWQSDFASVYCPLEEKWKLLIGALTGGTTLGQLSRLPLEFNDERELTLGLMKMAATGWLA